MIVNIHEAKTQFSKLVARALAGEDVVVAKNGKPLIRLQPLSAPSGTRTPGLSRSKVTIAPDFDEPLPIEYQHEFEA
ncbi:MAG: type II toxin-antitoxin system Phd/YefM family antitoxin [Spirochaetaceae bacterium]|nr:MAG: type II toxin-antitoxin system Phd/YefM family antitoxin [Spirochaetaceae bacterium]